MSAYVAIACIPACITLLGTPPGDEKRQKIGDACYRCQLTIRRTVAAVSDLDAETHKGCCDDGKTGECGRLLIDHCPSFVASVTAHPRIVSLLPPKKKIAPKTAITAKETAPPVLTQLPKTTSG